MNAARPHSLSGLYIILDPSVCPARPLVEVLSAAADAGASLFQYRNKTASMKDAYVEAVALRQAAARAGAFFIVNDRCDLAVAVNADGVHLGQGDLPLDLARKVMGPIRIRSGKPLPENRTILVLVQSSNPGQNRITILWSVWRGYGRFVRSRPCPSSRSVAFNSTRFRK
jgi:hypothetical protein